MEKPSLKAKLPVSTCVLNGRNYSGDKEEIARFQVVAYNKGVFGVPVVARCWMGRSRNASTVYAAVWAFTADGERAFAGHGSAGGYGYHKTSAAIDAAIASAGITLWGSPHLNRGEAPDFKKRARIDGVGDSAIREALGAIARAIGYRKFTIV